MLDYPCLAFFFVGKLSLLLCKMTGEGKTDVCAAIASILARSGRFSAIHIITSGEANAKKDFMATKDYIKAATGHDPILASDGIPWNEDRDSIAFGQFGFGSALFAHSRQRKFQKQLDNSNSCVL